MGLPRVTIDGRMAGDAELKFTPSGVAVANFTVVGNDRKMNSQTNEWEDGPPCFLRCSVWRDTAENVAETLRKGDAVLVTGRLTQREYENKDGIKVTVIEVAVETIGPSLRWKKKAERQQGGQGAQGDPWSTPASPSAQPAQPAQQRPAQPAQQGGWGGQQVEYGEPPFFAPPNTP